MSLLARIGRLFPENATVDSVQTILRFEEPPATVWDTMMFYEEIPRRPSALLRLFLPLPVRTRGDKTRPGSLIECTYDGGWLEKRITGVEVSRAIRFEVCKQELGIEGCIEMTGGSYELRGDDGGTELVLTTRYRGRLRPRWFWRPFERFIARGVHNHILEGMRVAFADARSTIGARALAK